MVTGLLVLAGVLSLGWWLARDPVGDFITSQPGLDNRGEGGVVSDSLKSNLYNCVMPARCFNPSPPT